MNFAFGVIIIVGLLAAASIGFIAVSPDDIIEPRIVPVEEKPTICTMQWEPMCGVDGETYGNQCMLDAEGVALDYAGECVIVEPISEPAKTIAVNSHIMPKTATVGDALLIEVEFMDDDGNIVNHVNYDITAVQGVDTILSDPGSHRHPGKHPVHETTVLGESPVEIQVVIQGLGHGDDITGPKGIESSMTLVPKSQSEPSPTTSAVLAPPVSHTVEIPQGSGTPGCDDTDECFLPYSLEVRVFDTVIWNNIDTAPHTVTSGSIDDGSSGVFDSGLLMSGDTFEFTFNETGTFDYFCIVHPWMTGVIIVNQVEEMIVVSEPTPEPEPTVVESVSEPTAEILPSSFAILIPNGVGVPGCDETNECYSPYDVTVGVDETVIWSNDDTAPHTVTSGTIDAGFTGVFDSGLLVSGDTFEFTFNETGTFDYFCTIHPWMTGIIRVS